MAGQDYQRRWHLPLPSDWKANSFSQQPVLRDIVRAENSGEFPVYPADALSGYLETCAGEAGKEPIRDALAQVLSGSWESVFDVVTAAEVILLSRSEANPEELQKWRARSVDMTATLNKLLLRKTPSRYRMVVTVALEISPEALHAVTFHYWRPDILGPGRPVAEASATDLFLKYATMAGANCALRINDFATLLAPLEARSALRNDHPGEFAKRLCERTIMSSVHAARSGLVDEAHFAAVMSKIPAGWVHLYRSLFDHYIASFGGPRAKELFPMPNWFPKVLERY